MVTSTASGTKSYGYALKKINKLLAPGLPVPDLDEWVSGTSESGAKAFLKSLVGAQRGTDLKAIDDQYKVWFAALDKSTTSIEYVRASVTLNMLLRRYIGKKKGLLEGDGNRKVGYFHLVEAYTRDSYVRLLNHPEAQPLEMASSLQWAHEEYYLRPIVRRDIIQLLASVRVSNNWIADGLSLVSVSIVTGIQAGGHHGSMVDNGKLASFDFQGADMNSQFSHELVSSVNRGARQMLSGPQAVIGVDPTTQISSEEDLVGLASDDAYAGEIDDAAIIAIVEQSTTQEMRKQAVEEGKSETLGERFAKIGRAIGKAIVWLYDKLVELLRHVYDNIDSYLPILKAIAKMCVVKCVKSCGLVVGASLDLAENAMEAAKTAYKGVVAHMAKKKALPLTESMQMIHNAFIAEARTDTAINLALAAASAVSLAGQVMSAGASILGSILANTLGFFIKTAWKLYKLMKVREFLTEVRLIYASPRCMGYGDVSEDGSPKYHEMGSVEYQTSVVAPSSVTNYRSLDFRAAPYLDHNVAFNENNSFTHLLYRACKLSIILPSIILLSGVTARESGEAFLFYSSVEWVLADQTETEGQVLSWNSEDPRRVKSQEYLETLQAQASDYLVKCGLVIGAEVVSADYDGTREHGYQDLWGSAFAISSVRGRSSAVT